MVISGNPNLSGMLGVDETYDAYQCALSRTKGYRPPGAVPGPQPLLQGVAANAQTRGLLWCALVALMLCAPYAHVW